MVTLGEILLTVAIAAGGKFVEGGWDFAKAAVERDKPPPVTQNIFQIKEEDILKESPVPLVPIQENDNGSGTVIPDKNKKFPVIRDNPPTIRF